MSAHMEFVRQNVAAGTIRASAEGIRVAVVVTDDELVTGRAGLFGRWGNRVERFPLGRLAGLRVVPNPSAYLLQLEFRESAAGGVTVMYEQSAKQDFDAVVRLLQQRLQHNSAGDADDQQV